MIKWVLAFAVFVFLSSCSVEEPPHYYIVTGTDKISGVSGDFKCYRVGYGKGYWSCYDEDGNKIARFTGKRSKVKVYINE